MSNVPSSDDSRRDGPAAKAREGDFSVGRSAATGAFWGGLQTVVDRSLGLIQQIALAWLLGLTAFGEVALALTVSALVSVAVLPGLDQVVVQRFRRERLWSGPALGLSLFGGGLAGVLCLALAPVAAWVFDTPGVAGLVVILGIAQPFAAVAVIGRAVMLGRLRFAWLARFSVLTTLLRVTLTISLAALGGGSWSFVIPELVIGVISAGWLCWVARPSTHGLLRFRRWRWLLTDSLHVTAARIIQTLILYGDRIVLGLVASTEVVGLYFWAMSQSTIFVRAVAANIWTALYPSFSRIKDQPQRLLTATLNGARLIALVATPLLSLQIILAGPVIRLVFDPRWHDGIVLVQLLTAGFVLQAPVWAYAAMMTAQRRFAAMSWLWLLSGLIFFALTVGAAIVGSRSGSTAVAVAIAVMVSTTVSAMVFAYGAVGRKVPAWTLATLSIPSITASLLASLPAVVVSVYWLNQRDRLGDLSTILVTLSVLPIYYLIIRRLEPEMTRRLTSTGGPVLNSIRVRLTARKPQA